jgi:hypothetical protein
MPTGPLFSYWVSRRFLAHIQFPPFGLSKVFISLSRYIIQNAMNPDDVLLTSAALHERINELARELLATANNPASKVDFASYIFLVTRRN